MRYTHSEGGGTPNRERIHALNKKNCISISGEGKREKFKRGIGHISAQQPDIVKKRDKKKVESEIETKEKIKVTGPVYYKNGSSERFETKRRVRSLKHSYS